MTEVIDLPENGSTPSINKTQVETHAANVPAFLEPIMHCNNHLTWDRPVARNPSHSAGRVFSLLQRNTVEQVKCFALQTYRAPSLLTASDFGQQSDPTADRIYHSR